MQKHKGTSTFLSWPLPLLTFLRIFFLTGTSAPQGLFSSESGSWQGLISLHRPFQQATKKGSHYKDMVRSLPLFHMCLVVMASPLLLGSLGYSSLKFHIRECWSFTLAIGLELILNLQHPIPTWLSRSSSTSNPVAGFRGRLLMSRPHPVTHKYPLWGWSFSVFS